MHTETEEELAIIDNNFPYENYLKEIAQIITVMINLDFPIIKRRDLFTNNLYNIMLDFNYIAYYRYLINFFENEWKSLDDIKKAHVLSKFLGKEKDLLDVIDIKWYENFILDKKNIYEQIERSLYSYSGRREFIKNLQEKIELIKKIDANILLNFKLTVDQESKLKEWRNICNVFVHFENKKDYQKKFSSSLIAVYKLYPQLKIIQEKINNLKKDNDETYYYCLSKNDLKFFNDINANYNFFIQKSKKIFDDILNYQILKSESGDNLAFIAVSNVDENFNGK